MAVWKICNNTSSESHLLFSPGILSCFKHLKQIKKQLRHSTIMSGRTGISIGFGHLHCFCNTLPRLHITGIFHCLHKLFTYCSFVHDYSFSHFHVSAVKTHYFTRRMSEKIRISKRQLPYFEFLRTYQITFYGPQTSYQSMRLYQNSLLFYIRLSVQGLDFQSAVGP